MADERTLVDELKNTLSDNQAQLEETRQFQEKLLTTITEVQTKLSYQQTELLRITQLMSADNERSLTNQLNWQDRRLHTLETEFADIKDTASAQAKRGWEIKILLIGALVTALVGWASQGFPGLKPQNPFEDPNLEPESTWLIHQGVTCPDVRATHAGEFAPDSGRDGDLLAKN